MVVFPPQSPAHPLHLSVCVDEFKDIDHKSFELRMKQIKEVPVGFEVNQRRKGRNESERLLHPT
jgi:hypothetical protein